MEFEPTNLMSIGTKAQGKNELYRMLVVEEWIYLPPWKETSMLLISQVAHGDKKVSSNKNAIIPSTKYL